MAGAIKKIEDKLKREPAWVWYLGAGGSLAAIIALVVALHRSNATAGAAQAASSPGATSLGSSLAPTPVSADPVSTTTITDTTDTYAPVSTVTTTTSSVDSHNFQQSFGNINGAGTGDCPTCGPGQVPAIPNTSNLPSFGGEGLSVDELRSRISALSANYAQDVASGNPAAAQEAHTQAEFLRTQAASQGLGTLQSSKYGYEQL